MNEYTFEMGGKLYHRISNAAARGYYGAGVEILACPCNMLPENCYYRERICCKDKYPYGNTFDETVSVITGHNCFGKETGRYLAYYVEEGI